LRQIWHADRSCHASITGVQNHTFGKTQDGGDLEKNGRPMQNDMPMTIRSESKYEV